MQTRKRQCHEGGVIRPLVKCLGMETQANSKRHEFWMTIEKSDEKCYDDDDG